MGLSVKDPKPINGLTKKASRNNQKRQINVVNGGFQNFEPKKVVIVSKTTRLQFEVNRARISVNDPPSLQFIQQLRNRGSDYYALKRKYDKQMAVVDLIRQELLKDEIEVKVAFRADYTKDIATWADLIISAGGDGTFLTAASKIRDQTPVIGINTDPVGSEGHLCLTGKSTRPADDVIRQFLKGDFKWVHRQRIRVTITENGSNDSPPAVMSKRRSQNMKACNFFSDDESEDLEPPLEPVLALNEVFIGESHAARVSYYEVKIDDGPIVKQKSSGMTVCTGTGSTSWHYNINRITEQTVEEIIDLMTKMGLNPQGNVDGRVIAEVCRLYNQNLIFDPEAHKMAYSVRDPVFNATFQKTQARGFAQKIYVKSRCSHAHLVLDGSTSIPFNQGTEVLLELLPDDELCTVQLQKH